MAREGAVRRTDRHIVAQHANRHKGLHSATCGLRGLGTKSARDVAPEQATAHNFTGGTVGMSSRFSSFVATLALSALPAAGLMALGCNLGGESSPELPVYDAATFYETTTIFGASFSEDESRILFTSDASGVFNVYSQPFEGGEPKQLTFSETDAVFSIGWFPRDDRFLFTSDRGGDELNHVYVQEEDGNIVDLTPGEGLKAMFAGWSGDEESFWVLSNERDARFFDLYRYAVDGYGRELVLKNDEGWSIAAVSRDGRWVALDRSRTTADSDVYVQDLEDGERYYVTPHEGSVTNTTIAFTPDSRELYYMTDGAGEFTQAWSYDLTSAEHTPIVVSDWDVMSVAFSENGRYRVSAINANARTEVTILDTASGEELVLPELPEGDLRGVEFSSSESRLAFYVNSDRSPSNLYVLDFDAGGAARRLTIGVKAPQQTTIS